MSVSTVPQELSQNLDVLGVAERWQAEGRKLVLATVIETWGSAPRPVGSYLIIDENGEFEGSVSGGCVEGAVVAEAMDVLEDGKRGRSSLALPMRQRGGLVFPAAGELAFTCSL